MLYLKKRFLFFISFRTLALLFALNIFPRIQRGFSDAMLFLEDYQSIEDSGILSLDPRYFIFGMYNIVNKFILSFLLPTNISLASIVLTLIISSIIWINLREFLLQRNSFLLWITIFLPGYSMYSTLPSKEATFIAFSIIYICFEARNIVYKPIKNWNDLNLLSQRFFYLLICMAIRGIPAVPYIILGFFVSLFPLISPFLIKYKNRKSNHLILILLSAFFTLLIVGILIPSEHPFFLGKNSYLQGSFLTAESTYKANLSREFLAGKNAFELFNFIKLPYLSLFPTIQELISNPKLFIYLIESFTYVTIYLIAWRKVINTSLLNSRKIKFIQYLFISITISYIFIYSIIGAYNLGSSLRFRQNFSNVGHVLPLIIFYNCQNKNYFKLSKFMKKN